MRKTRIKKGRRLATPAQTEDDAGHQKDEDKAGQGDHDNAREGAGLGGLQLLLLLLSSSFACVVRQQLAPVKADVAAVGHKPLEALAHCLSHAGRPVDSEQQPVVPGRWARETGPEVSQSRVERCLRVAIMAENDFPLAQVDVSPVAPHQHVQHVERGRHEDDEQQPQAKLGY